MINILVWNDTAAADNNCIEGTLYTIRDTAVTVAISTLLELQNTTLS